MVLGGSDIKFELGFLLGVGLGCYNYPELRCDNLNPVYLDGVPPIPPIIL